MPKIVADLHLHSHFSRATSADLTIEHLWKWAQLKGVNLLITGDIAHPGWLGEIKEKLEPAGDDLFQLKPEVAKGVIESVPAACRNEVRFLLGGEVSNIYKKNDAVRKIHHMLYLPDIASVEQLQARLERIGNIRADGRPIFGLDSRDLLEILLEVNPRNHLIPAHIWTPWFAVLGSKSGFDSIDECFDDLTPHIFAVETGLSSDPPMNWRVSSLDRYTLISNSDAHSPQKLAREATLFDIDFSYAAMFAALKSGDPQHFRGTLEFFPEEGKYHVDGHRACGIRWEPEETLLHHKLCPVCGNEVTIGVLHRVNELADRAQGTRPTRPAPYHNLIPLPEILGQVYGVGASSKKVLQTYDTLLSKLGAELTILLETPIEEITSVGGELLAEGIRRVRAGEVQIAGGYDGEYGTIKLFEERERQVSSGQIGLFGEVQKTKTPPPTPPRGRRGESVANLFNMEEVTQKLTPPALREWRGEPDADTINGREMTGNPPSPPLFSGEGSGVRPTSIAQLNPQQQVAAATIDTNLLIVAGPGTGKTCTLTVRIANLLGDHNIDPQSILAITFTNKAADEMRERLDVLLGSHVARQLTIKTFHAFGAALLRRYGTEHGIPGNFTICSEEDRAAILSKLLPERNEREINQTLALISTAKNQLQSPDSPTLEKFAPDDPAFVQSYLSYEQALHDTQMLDFDDLLFVTVRLLEANPTVLADVQARYRWISVDEYQDINLTQYRLLRLLTSDGANLCAIGDPDQAIYGFRGADRRYFLQFQTDYPNTTVLHLDQNYRSTEMIVNASSQVITRSVDRLPLALRAIHFDPTRLDIHHAPTDKAEAEFVVHQIEQMVGGTTMFSLDSKRATGREADKRSFGDVAVLFRLSAQSHNLIEAFDRSGIPYQHIGQTPLRDYKEIREILAYLQVVYNPASEHARSILLDSAAKKQQDLITTFIGGLGREVVVHKQIKSVSQFRVESLGRRLNDAQRERVQQLGLRATPYGDQLGDFLEAVALQKETDFYDPTADRVTLMTLHAAKGLEFPMVFLVGCEEGLLPYVREGEAVDFEEERRLFYVGMTRAQRKLVLTHAHSRFLFGKRMENRLSHFVEDIEKALLEVKKMADRKLKVEQPEQLALF